MVIKKVLILPILIVLTVQSVWADGQCYDMVKQYYECQKLKMVKNEDGIFSPDPDVTGNSLDESFYQTQDLLSKSFSQAMSFFKKIFDTAYLKGNKCKKLCLCLKGYTTQFFKVLPIIFKNQKSLVDTTKIVSDFMNTNKQFLLSEEYMLDYFYPTAVSNTLAKFCIRNEFSSSLTAYYNSTFCYYATTIEEVFDASYELIFKNGIVQPDDSRVYSESLLVNQILNLQSCPRETQRLEVLLYWAPEVPQLTWTGTSLASYLDGLIKKVLTTEPKIKFLRTYIFRTYKSFNDKFIIIRTDQTRLVFEILFNSTNVSTSYTDTCFKTTNLRIDCTWLFNPSKTYLGLAQLNYTFLFPQNPSGKQKFNYQINTQLNNLKEKKKYVKGPTNKKLIYLKETFEEGICVNEFNTNTNVYTRSLRAAGFEFYLPTTLASRAEGILATGIVNVPWLKPVSSI